MGSNGARKGLTFEGINVYLSRNLVAPELYDALQDALRLNGATVYTICDPDRNSPLDFHVISSPNHEKFANLKSRGCNLLGPQCVFFCAKEHKTFPQKHYTCCLAMDGVKVLTSGFEKDEKILIEERVSAMGGVLLKDATLDANFVVVKHVLASKYQWALNVLKKTIVTKSWLDSCWAEHRLVPQEPYRIPPFTGLTICVTKIPLEERKELGRVIVQNGGKYSADLTKKCTHLVSDGIGGDKYLVARKWERIYIVNRRWVDQSIIKRARLDEASFPCSRNGTSNSSQKSKSTASWTPQPSQSQPTSTSAHPSPSQNGSLSVPNTLPYAPPKGTAEVAARDSSRGVSADVAPPSTVFDALRVGAEVGSSGMVFGASKRGGAEVARPGTDLDAARGGGAEVAEDSEEDDLYLSECRVGFVGFDERETGRLIGLLMRGGGTRHVSLSNRLTHIVVGSSPSELEKMEVRKLAAWGVINIVKSTWLEDCDKRKKEIPVLPLHIASDLISSKDSGLAKSTDNGGTNGIKRSQPEKNYTKAPGILEFGSKPETQTQTNGSKTTQTSSKESDLFKNSNTFKGKIFCFSTSFPLDRRAEIIGWVNKGGGIIVEDPKRIKVHFIIENHGIIDKNNTNNTHSSIVSTQWIRSSLQEGLLQDIKSHIIYSPLKCRVPLPGFEKFKFSFSQYEEREKLLLKNLCFVLGAKITDRFTKKVTHLLCKFTSGPKYEACCKLGLQAVTSDWIYECVRKDMIVPLDEFRPRDVTPKDRAENLCTVTQYSSQANRILLSQTQLTNCSKDINPEEGFCEEIESLGTSAKKPKVEVSKNPSDVADVAKAIEDLLAQSSKIQDMKMPDQPAFERNVFTSDHSVLGTKDHENPQSIITLSRHWLNKTEKQDKTKENLKPVQSKNPGYDAFSETQTESQVVGYEEDLSGRQKIIDRVRSQSMTLTPSNELLPSVV